jgi:hypothetical protein
MGVSTFGMGGHGLLVAPACPCRVLLTGGDLVFAHGPHEVARIQPGTRAATKPLTWHGSGRGQFGSDGPTVLVTDGKRYEDVFLQIDVGLPDSPWCALGPGMIMDMPEGVVLLSSAPGDDDPMFELHLHGGKQEFIRFMPARAPADVIRLNPAPNQDVIASDHLDVEDDDGSLRQLRYADFAYDHEGDAWLQRAIVVPWGPGSLIVSAQARVPRSDELFRAARHVAATIAPLR